MGKNIVKRERGKQYHLPYDSKAVGKTIKWGRGEGNGNFWKILKILKNEDGEEYQVVGNFIHPCEMVS